MMKSLQESKNANGIQQTNLNVNVGLFCSVSKQNDLIPNPIQEEDNSEVINNSIRSPVGN